MQCTTDRLHTVYWSMLVVSVLISMLVVLCNSNTVVCGGCTRNSDMACSVAGITSDANVLTNQLRLFCQRHLLHYGEPVPCEQLVASLCDIKQAYTQFGGACIRILVLMVSGLKQVYRRRYESRRSSKP